jgi:TonB family protein
LKGQLSVKQLTELLSHEPTLSLTIASDGTLVDSKLSEPTGIRKLDNSIINAARATKFEPLPEWFKGEQLILQINLNKIMWNCPRPEQTTPDLVRPVR